MQKKLNQHAGILALAALVIAMLGSSIVGANAAIHFISGKNIKPGTITSKQIKNETVKAPDLGNDSVGQRTIAPESVEGEALASNSVGDSEIKSDAVSESDIANEAVGAEQVNLPEPTETVIVHPLTGSMSAGAFGLVGAVGTFVKEDPASTVQVTWTGSGEEGQETPFHSPCIFQLRIDGVPTGGGEALVKGQASVSVSALFSGLPVGQHGVEIWARHTGTDTGSCTVDPSGVGIDQSIIVSEEVG